MWVTIREAEARGTRSMLLMEVNLDKTESEQETGT